MVKLKPF